ncbi:MAG TPA: HEAT repeat domain-containing protein [Tepidisphaeraceae bacterium]|jgi:quinoprotein glucose dehydrogenase|nr:HEAT repeat domain-containing protein [Tepidisphaeraceae bacterium]
MQKSTLLAAIRHAVIPATLFAAACAAFGAGHEVTKDKAEGPEIRPASQEGEQAIGHIKVADGLKIELWAAEPMLANPVCMRVDNRDRVYVIETFRHTSNVLDIRGHMDWLTEDLACRSVADRVALLRRKMGPNIRKMTQDDDRIRLIEDTTGSGVANKATVFASGFNKIESGIAAGLLPTKQGVYLADIPDLWLLKDTKGQGVSDERAQLSTGYGVHISFLGHDLHGLAMGPDHKIYFSIGDRGTNAKAVDGSTVFLPDTGGVFRCNRDGSHLEIFATGLRNPQQLCFDDLGNLMTGDNNPDYGDPARWVYVVEGGDSGWRIGYQEARFPKGGGPWMWESLWQTEDKLKDAAYILPPVAHLGSGPSGVAFYPGTGMPEKYNRHFFMVDFRGGSSGSTVHSFALDPAGASYKLVDHGTFIKGMLATDIDWSTRGGMYACDWTEGWNKPGKGRIYRIFDSEVEKQPIVAQTQKILADGFEGKSKEELVKFLFHPDRRVREAAQFALADKGADAMGDFANVANNSKDQLSRLHSIWGLGNIGQTVPEAYKFVLPLLSDKDAEVRAQAAKVLGDGHFAAAYDGLIKLLSDPEPRPKFFAAIALSHLGREEAVKPLLAMLKENADKDAHLRHAGVMGLVGSNNFVELMNAATDPSPSVRMGVLLALRRLKRPEIAQFLSDTDPHLLSEAAHAINDVPIPEAYPALATLLDRTGLPETVSARAVNAAFRVGTPKSAQALAIFAAKNGAPDWVRVEALDDLGTWSNPDPLDRIMHMYWPLPKRPEGVATQAAGLAVGQILHPADGAKVPDAVRKAAVTLIKTLKINDTAVLFDLVSGKNYAADLRAEALGALADRNDPKLAEAVKIGLADSEPAFKEAAIRALAKLPNTTAQLKQFLESGTVGEQQAAIAALAETKDESAEPVLSDALDKLLAGKLKPELQLDLLEAAQKNKNLLAKAAKFNDTLPKNDPLAEFRVALAGGNAASGHAIFERSDASCIRCHVVHGTGGQVGPALDGVGTRQTREYLLESIVLPNAKIAPGFETAVIKLKDGKTVTGIVKKETPAEVTLLNADGQEMKVETAQIKSREHGISAMPEGFGKTLSKHDLRDLVEYLSELKK